MPALSSCMLIADLMIVMVLIWLVGVGVGWLVKQFRMLRPVVSGLEFKAV